MIDCVGIEIKKEDYPEWHDKEFSSLSEYLTAAEKAVKYFISLLKPELTKVAANDEDLISGVAYAMMIADWKWRPDGGRAKYSYRNNYAWYYIRSYLARRAKYAKRSAVYLSTFDKEMLTFSFLDEKASDPLDILIKNNDISLFDEVKRTMTTDTLSEREIFCIDQYFCGEKTYQTIGQTIGVTKERVRQNINSGIKKLQGVLCSN